MYKSVKIKIMPTYTKAEKKKLVKALPHRIKHKAVVRAKAKHQAGHGLPEILKTVESIVGHPATQMLGKVFWEDVIKPELHKRSHHHHHKGGSLRLSGVR